MVDRIFFFSIVIVLLRPVQKDNTAYFALFQQLTVNKVLFSPAITSAHISWFPVRA